MKTMDEKIRVERTTKTPYVLIDNTKGVIDIRGRSIPEGATGFYEPLITDLGKIEGVKNNVLAVTVQLEYIGTQSTRMLFKFLKKLEEHHNSKKFDLSVKWFYEEDDDSGYDDAHDFKSLISVPFEVVGLNSADYDRRLDEVKFVR